jgi:gluconolactonase
VNCYTPAGELLGRIPFAADVTNLAFGGPAGDMVFVTMQTSLFAFRVSVRGAQTP